MAGRIAVTEASGDPGDLGVRHSGSAGSNCTRCDTPAKKPSESACMRSSKAELLGLGRELRMCLRVQARVCVGRRVLTLQS